jgi:hypothetical protein
LKNKDLYRVPEWNGFWQLGKSEFFCPVSGSNPQFFPQKRARWGLFIFASGPLNIAFGLARPGNGKSPI